MDWCPDCGVSLVECPCCHELFCPHCHYTEEELERREEIYDDSD